MSKKLTIRELDVTINVPMDPKTNDIGLNVVHMLENCADELIRTNYFSDGEEVDTVEKVLRAEPLADNDDMRYDTKMRLHIDPKQFIQGHVNICEYDEKDVFYIELLSDPDAQGVCNKTKIPYVKVSENGDKYCVFMYGDIPVATSPVCLITGESEVLRESDVLAFVIKLEDKKAYKYKEFLQQFM